MLWVPKNINGGIDYTRHDGLLQNIFTGALFQRGRNVSHRRWPLFDRSARPTRSTSPWQHGELRCPPGQCAGRAQRRAPGGRPGFLRLARGTRAKSRRRCHRCTARKLVSLTEGLSPGLIAPLEINRARAELQSLLQTRELAIRDWRVAGAVLTEILLLDTRALARADRADVRAGCTDSQN